MYQVALKQIREIKEQVKIYVMSTILLCLLLSFPNSLSAQEVTKEYIDELIRISEESPSMKMDEVKGSLDEIADLSIEISYGFGQVYACHAFACLNVNNAPKVALNYIEQVDSLLQLYPGDLSDENEISILLTRGYATGALGGYFQELDYYLTADSLADILGSEDVQSIVNQYITSYYIVSREYKKALVYNQKLLQFYKEHSDPKIMRHPYLNTMLNRGGVYLRMHSPDSAIYYVKLAIKKGLGDHTDLNYPYYILGKAYLQKDDIKQTKKYVNLMNTVLDSMDNHTLDGAQAKLLTGNLHQRLDEFDLAEDAFRQALIFADSAAYIEGKIEANFELVENYLKKIGANDLVLNLQNFSELTDTVYYHKSSQLEKQLMIQFETNKKEQEILALKYQKEVNEKTIVWIVLVALVLILLLIMLFYRYKTKKKILLNELEKEQLVKEIATQNLEIKTKDLNQAIEKIKENVNIIEKFKSENISQVSIEEIMSVLGQNYVTENQWAKIVLNFDVVHDNYAKNMIAKFPNLTSNDIRLLVLIKLGYSNKGVAEVNNISEEGAKKAKQRLFKRLGTDGAKLLTETRESTLSLD